MRGVRRTTTVVEIVHEAMTPEQLVPPGMVSRFVPVYQAAGCLGGAEPVPVEHLEHIIRAELEKVQAETAAKTAAEGRGGGRKKAGSKTVRNPEEVAVSASRRTLVLRATLGFRPSAMMTRQSCCNGWTQVAMWPQKCKMAPCPFSKSRSSAGHSN